MPEPIRVLFVCLGNIVRSPLAETLFRLQVGQAGLGEKYEIDSAGTAAYHVGERPDARMRQVAAEHAVKHDGRARQVREEDFEDFDLIIAMDASNKSNLEKLTQSPQQVKKIHMMREFDPQVESDLDVPDPYYGGMNGFEFVFQMIERSTQELLRQMEEGEVKVG